MVVLVVYGCPDISDIGSGQEMFYSPVLRSLRALQAMETFLPGTNQGRASHLII